MNYNKNKPSHLFGYSYIEVMIVIMIMALLFSVGMANYRGFQRRQSLEAAVRQVRSTLALAREFAIAGKTECPSLNFELVGYRALFSQLNDTITIQEICHDPGTGLDLPNSNDTYDILDGFDLTYTLAEVTFLPLARGVQMAGNAQVVLTLTQANLSSSQTITIHSNGRIE